MGVLSILVIAVLVFAICFLADKGFTRLFRSKRQHRSGLAVRANKRYGSFGVILLVLGILSVCLGFGSDKVLLVGGGMVAVMGAWLLGYYLSFGIFYDGESFLLCRFGRKDREHRYDEIVSQKLYTITGGSTVIELTLKDGSVLSLQSTMDGVYPFMDTAFAGWCLETGRRMEDCDFYDPAKSWWFPHETEEEG